MYRPKPKTGSVWWDVLFISTVTSAQFNAQGLIGSTMVPVESIATGMLDTRNEQEYAWMNASYALTAGLFVLVGGRLGDKYSSKTLFLLGYFLLFAFNLGIGFTSSPISFDILRAFAGIGAAFAVPNSIALLGKQYEPGIQRTIAFSSLGALAPIGFQVHAVFASLVAERVQVRWIFWLEAIFCALCGLIGFLVIPQDEFDRSIRIDWIGVSLGLAGMILFNFAWNQAPLVLWSTAYVPVLLGVGIALIVLFFLWERRQGDKALLPTMIFTKDVIGTCIALWFGWMSFGIFLFYTVSFIRDIRGFHQPLVICAQLATLAPLGALAALAVIWLTHRQVPGHWILAASCACFCIGNVLMGVTPRSQTFWAMVFPAEIIIVFGPDLSFASGALIIANSIPRSMLGVGGGLMNLITNYSISIGLGIAGTIEVYTNDRGRDVLKGYRAAFWFASCISFAGLLLVLAVVRVRSGHGGQAYNPRRLSLKTVSLEASGKLIAAMNSEKAAATTYTGEEPKGGNPRGAIEKPETTLREDVAAYGLEKVYERHGRIDLIPLPSDSHLDPLNWPSWKKHMVLFQVAFYAMMGPFSAAAVIPAFEAFTEDFNISITQASYTVSIVILFLCSFLIFGPIANRIGRRPVLLVSLIIAAGCHLAGAYVHSYGTMMTVRVFQGIFLSPPLSIGASMINEMFFLHEKASKLGVWTLLTTLGPPVAPLVFGPVIYHERWQWVFYVLAVTNLVQFVLYVFFGPETLYDRPVRGIQQEQVLAEPPSQKREAWWRPYVTFRRWDRTPWSRMPAEMAHPFALFASPTVFLPTLAYSIAFSYSNVLLTVEIPALLGRKYMLTPQGVGLQFIAACIGAILGEIIAGKGSDWFMQYRTRRAHGNRVAEFRLPFALPGYLLAGIGIIVFGVCLQDSQPGHWNIRPLIGVAIALFGNQLLTTVTYSYAIESLPPTLAPKAPAFIATCRQVFAFTAPFYLNLIFEELGDAKAAGLLAALTMGFGFIASLAFSFSRCITACMVWGQSWRRKHETH
ncbi:uncharacterized protein JCM15063_002022 [Sporobolomyces koalae]|uniref:uncharacterized protein n=1 Tax=Sporobolomyces koalae TaxID=500713 RepID=UPI00317ACE78